MKTKNRIWFCPLVVMVLLILTHSCKKDEKSNEIKDADGNVYTSVTIGTQVWIVENLKTTKYNDNTDIPLVTDNTAWSNLSTPGYCWYNNDASTYKTPYGAMYNWFAVATGKLCPIGWHVATDNDFSVLANYLGGLSVAGDKLKEAGTAHWLSPNTGATNESGFTALPGGYRGPNGTYVLLGDHGYLLAYDVSSVYCYSIGYNESRVTRNIGFGNKSAASVRCLKD
jgi:uncharacterized protein (TIGR02145 family)